MTNLAEVAERICKQLLVRREHTEGAWGARKSVVLDEIKRVREEAWQHGVSQVETPLSRKAWKNGFECARERAAHVAFMHNCDSSCDVDAQLGGGGCAVNIRDAIRSLTPSSEEVK